MCVYATYHKGYHTNKWWSRAIALTLVTGPFTIVHSSKAADCSSLVSVVSVGRRAYAMPRQARSMWFTFLHLPHRLPYAGHWLIRMLHGGFFPWPFSALNRHSAVGSNVSPGFGSGLGLVVAAPLVRTSCCLLLAAVRATCRVHTRGIQQARCRSLT